MLKSKRASCVQKFSFRNPGTCSCKNHKYPGCIIEDSVVICNEIIDTTKSTSTKTIPAKTIPTKTVPAKCFLTNFYILLYFTLITATLLIAVSIYCYLIKCQAKPNY